MEMNFDLLNFIKYQNLNTWDVKRFSSINVESNFKIEKLSNLLLEQNKKIKIFEQPEQNFKILGVNNQTGLFDAYIEKGCNINQPYKKVENGFFAYNPYRINVGSIGLKSDQQTYEYISPAYVVFSCKKELLPEYLEILLKTEYFNKKIKENTTGSVRQTLAFNRLCDIDIPLPSLTKQAEVVNHYKNHIKLCEGSISEAKKIDASIENFVIDFLEIDYKDQNCKNSKLIKFIEYKDVARWDFDYNYNISQGIFAFTSKYPIIKMNNIINYTQYGTSDQATYTSGEIPVLRMNNIVDGDISTQDIKYIEKANKYKSLILKKGDLLINRTNGKELVGKTAVFNKDENYIFASYLIRIRFSEKTNPDFINILFNTSIIRRQIDAVSRQITGLANINIEEIKNIIIPLPPLDAQNKIVNEVFKRKEKTKYLHQKAKELKVQAIETFEKEVLN